MYLVGEECSIVNRYIVNNAFLNCCDITSLFYLSPFWVLTISCRLISSLLLTLTYFISFLLTGTDFISDQAFLMSPSLYKSQPVFYAVSLYSWSLKILQKEFYPGYFCQNKEYILTPCECGTTHLVFQLLVLETLHGILIFMWLFRTFCTWLNSFCKWCTKENRRQSLQGIHVYQ